MGPRKQESPRVRAAGERQRKWQRRPGTAALLWGVEEKGAQKVLGAHSASVRRFGSIRRAVGRLTTSHLREMLLLRLQEQRWAGQSAMESAWPELAGLFWRAVIAVLPCEKAQLAKTVSCSRNRVLRAARRGEVSYQFFFSVMCAEGWRERECVD